MLKLPLFPLRTVLFPGMPLALHIFEDRYKEMMRRCIERSSPFGVVLIKHGDEVGPAAEPYAIGCTARVVQVEPLPEGRMNLLDWIVPRGSAPVARDRLKILLAYERTSRGQPDLLGLLREEIMVVIGRHVTVAPDKVQVRVDRGQAVSTLAIDIEIPSAHGALAAAGRR